ncbi:hypothetical protein GE09DRAFT_1210722 [Coniochaeta sp. 2T2.1]|nr:hypothetical protein GE09DRAFT_1210722 [Coniochaeta sp. 2T2.1]
MGDAAMFGHLQGRINQLDEQARRRIGEIPTDHVPPGMLVKMHASVLANDVVLTNLYRMWTLLPQSPYLPCTRPGAELEPITIAHLQIGTHHRGRSVLVRIVTPPLRLQSNLTPVQPIIAIVKDAEGAMTMLQLWHSATKADTPVSETLRVGSTYLIKEPLFKLLYNWVPGFIYCLRVDHYSDILLLPDDHELLPVQWRGSQAKASTSKHLRVQGNEAVAKKAWAEAERLYTSAIKAATTTEERQLAYLNRSLAYLQLGRPAPALADAAKASSLHGGKPPEKGLFREAMALYQLAKFEQCLEKLELLAAAYPSGISSKATVGELLVCEKAFAYAYVGEKASMSNDVANYPSLADGELLGETVQKLYHDSEASQLFTDLPRGTYEVVSSTEVDGHPVVDKVLIARVVEESGFRTSRATSDILKAAASLKRVAGNEASGLWPLVSLINHSCIANCSHSFIGDMHIVRAAQDIEARSELSILYLEPLPNDSYDDTQKRFQRWNFRCDCPLCLDKKSTSKQTMDRRNAYLQQLSQNLSPNNIYAAKRAIGQALQTYSAWAKSPGSLMCGLGIHYFLLAGGFHIANKPAEAIEIYLKGFEASGFVFAEASGGIGKKVKRKTLTIKQWGDYQVVMQFAQLYKACQKAASPIAAAVKRYEELAYLITVGEKETMLDTCPDLK